MKKEDIKLTDIEYYRKDRIKDGTIGTWKKITKEFAIKFNLTDIEAIKILND